MAAARRAPPAKKTKPRSGKARSAQPARGAAAPSGDVFDGERIVVTGGAGFIGCHTVEALVAAGAKVTVIDLQPAPAANLAAVWKKITYVQGDCGEAAVLDRVLPGQDSVWHLAADPDVRAGAAEPSVQFRSNLESTLGLLEGMRRHSTPELVFTSTSTVYGRADVRPTPEDYAPLLPVSSYGASKLACEAIIAAYADLLQFRCLMFRFANVVGERSGHGVIVDFVRKLKADPKRLEVLGDGTQDKSYCSVQDTVEAMMHAVQHATDRRSVFNIGSRDTTKVDDLAFIVAGVKGLKPKLVHTGGAADGSGWKGDVKSMLLASERLRKLGWRPRHTSAQAIEIAAKAAWQA